MREYKRVWGKLLLLIMTIAVCSNSGSAQEFELKANGKLRWMKGNMHTHSLWSDGDDFPETIASWYRERDYQFLVFTDHNTLHQSDRWLKISGRKGSERAVERLREKFPKDWIDERGEGDELEIRLKKFDEVFGRLAVPQEFLPIQGEEITDRFGRSPVHMCATNTNELLPPTGGDSIVEVMQRNIQAATSRRERTGVRTLVHLNHPNFGYAVTAEQLMRVVGENFFELYNGHPSVHNRGDATHASTERMWDIINSFRLTELDLPVMYGLGTDDGHNYFQTAPRKGAQPGRGWVVVLASTLTPDAIVESLEAGRFYSSSGVVLESVRFDGRALEVKIRGEEGVEYETRFVGTDRGFSTESTPASEDEETAKGLTRVYSDELGKTYQTSQGTSARYVLSGNELYVRAVVTSSKAHPNPSESGEFERAWVQPVVTHTGK